MRKYLLMATVLILMSGSAWAQTSETYVALDTGSCGAACTWTFYDNGLLDISGSGEMDNWSHDSEIWTTTAPWRDFYSDVLKVNVGQGLTTIGKDAFTNFMNVTEIKLPNTIKTIGENAFVSTPALKTFEIPNSVEIICQNAFMRSGIENIVVPDSVTSISSGAFASHYLNTLVLPANLQSISKKLLNTDVSGWDYSQHILELYCGSSASGDCQEALNVLAEQTGNFLHPIIYSKDSTGNYYMYDDKGNMVGKYASLDALKGKTPTETYKYDSAGHLVGIFDGNGQRTWGKKIYTVEEAMEATKNGDKFHVSLTYK